MLNGRFANTAFCIFDPQGEKHLTRSGRSPNRSMTSGESPNEDAKTIVRQMARIASSYQPKGDRDAIVLQDFHSFRQALNVASADQRLLLLVNATDKEAQQAKETLTPVFTDEEVLGKFHLHFVNAEADAGWSAKIKGDRDRSGILIIRSGQFGVTGVAMHQLSLDSTSEEVKAALLSANQEFSELEERKSYSSHVQAGKRQRIRFENEISNSIGDDKKNRQPRGRDRGNQRTRRDR